MNKYADVAGVMPSIHAEHDAILRLPCLKNKNKKLVKINLLVIRFLKTYTLANSKPCLKCIQNMIELPKKRGYKIEDIYYSDNNETIIFMMKLNLLVYKFPIQLKLLQLLVQTQFQKG